MTNSTKKKYREKSFLSTSPDYSESLISNLSRTETDSLNKYIRKGSSIYSTDRFDSSSTVTVEYRQRNQLTHLRSLDFVQSSPSFIYPNIRIIHSGYPLNEKNSTYIFSNTLNLNKNIPLIYLGNSSSCFNFHSDCVIFQCIGCEYFFRKSFDFEHLKYPLSTNEYIEPLIDLFLNRPQFIREIPQLTDLSNYRLLPKTILASIFLNSSIRHLCSELNTKEHKNKFNMKDLINMSQRENNIIQTNAVNDKRYQALKDQLTEIYSFNNI